MKRKMLAEIEKYLWNNTNLYTKVLSFLKSIYENFDNDIIVDNYYLNERSHTVYIKSTDNEYALSVELTKQYLQIQFLNNEELFVMLDDTSIKDALRLLNALFEGEFEIIYYLDESFNTIFKELRWNDENLKMFDQMYSSRLIFKSNWSSERRLKGKKLTNHDRADM